MIDACMHGDGRPEEKTGEREKESLSLSPLRMQLMWKDMRWIGKIGRSVRS
jgi:hypothetical protein